MTHWKETEKEFQKSWIKADWLHRPKIGDRIAYCTGFNWVETIYTEEMALRGYWTTGVHNETTSLINPAYGSIYFKPKTERVSEIGDFLREASDQIQFEEAVKDNIKVSLILSYAAIILSALAIALHGC